MEVATLALTSFSETKSVCLFLPRAATSGSQSWEGQHLEGRVWFIKPEFLCLERARGIMSERVHTHTYAAARITVRSSLLVWMHEIQNEKGSVERFTKRSVLSTSGGAGRCRRGSVQGLSQEGGGSGTLPPPAWAR